MHNIAVLLVFSMIYDYLWSRYESRKKLILKIPAGIILGCITIFIMMTPWKMIPGIVFDVRSVILSVSGLFFGFIPTVVAMIFAILYRLSIGGDGLWMGLTVIVSSGLIGITWRFLRPNWQTKHATLELLAMGFSVHLFMLGCTLLLPSDIARSTLKTIYLPVLTLYPTATTLLGLLMIHWSKTWENKKALLESEAQFKSVFEVAADAIFIADKETGIIIDANKSAGILMQMPREKIIGLHQSKLHPPATEIYTRELFLKGQLEKKQPDAILPVELKILRTDGVEVPVEIVSSPVVFKGKNCLMGNFRNITERKKTELSHRLQYNIANAVVTSKNQLELFEVVKSELNELVDTSNFFIAFYDEETEHLRKAFWADEMEHFEEWPIENSLSGIVVTEGKPLILTKDQMIKLSEERALNLIGTPSEYWLGFPLKLHQKVIGAMVIQNYKSCNPIEQSGLEILEIVASQISLYIEKMKDEERLIVSKLKAEESDRLKSAFLANMSHEIRTPMNGILGFLGLLNEPNLEEDNKREYLDVVNKSGQRLLDTINDILEISKIEAGENIVNFSEVNIEEVMQFQYAFFKQQTIEKGISLEISEQITGNLANIQTDGHKLNGILTNLIKNAIKFTDEGKIEMGNYLENNSLFFYIRDTGNGIPSDKLEKIFGHFIQADMNLNRNYEGSGLGLSIVKAYVEALGGKISVQSEIDKGSTFLFSIPYILAGTPNTAEEVHPTEQHQLSGQVTILVAEDDTASYQYLKAVLTKEKIRLVHTTNGTDTMKMLQENPEISLILMDIKMPGMDGLEATRRIRQFNPTIPIIAQSAYVFDTDKGNALEAGCNEYLPKPIDRKSLIEMINKYVGTD